MYVCLCACVLPAEGQIELLTVYSIVFGFCLGETESGRGEGRRSE